jgi:hypothetical protein
MSKRLPKCSFRMTKEDEVLLDGLCAHIQHLKMSGSTRTDAFRFALQQTAKTLQVNHEAAQ